MQSKNYDDFESECDAYLKRASIFNVQGHTIEMAMTIQVTGKLKINGKKQTVTGVAIEGSGEFFYSDLL